VLWRHLLWKQDLGFLPTQPLCIQYVISWCDLATMHAWVMPVRVGLSTPRLCTSCAQDAARAPSAAECHTAEKARLELASTRVHSMACQIWWAAGVCCPAAGGSWLVVVMVASSTSTPASMLDVPQATSWPALQAVVHRPSGAAPMPATSAPTALVCAVWWLPALCPAESPPVISLQGVAPHVVAHVHPYMRGNATSRTTCSRQPTWCRSSRHP
jgi:hypothetical protein